MAFYIPLTPSVSARWGCNALKDDDDDPCLVLEELDHQVGHLKAKDVPEFGELNECVFSCNPESGELNAFRPRWP